MLLTATSDYKINASQNTTQITILDSDSEWSVYVSYDLCMLTICKVYESLHHYVMVNVRAVQDIPEVVSAPDPHVTPSRKRVWYLTSEFLVVLSQHVRKTGNPIRSLDLKLSCDKKVVPHGTRMRGRADRI